MTLILCDTTCRDETQEPLPEPTVNEPKEVSQPKVWSDAPIIEDMNQIVKMSIVLYPKQKNMNTYIAKVNTTEVNAVSVVGGRRETAVKPSAGCNWRPKRHYWHKVSKYNGGSSPRNCATFKDPLGDSEKEDESAQDYFVLPIWSSYSSTIKRSTTKDAGEVPNKHPDLKTNEKPVDKEDQVFLDELKRLKRQEKDANDAAEALRKEFAQETKNLLLQAGAAKASSTNILNTVSTPVSTASPSDGQSFFYPTNPDQDDSEIPALEDIYKNPTDGIFTNSSYDDEGAVADFTNLETVVNVSPIPTSRINSIHPSTLILGDPQSAVQTRSKVTKSTGAHAFVSYIQKQRRNNHKDFQHCLFACFLSQNEPKKISEALKDESWVDAMQEELLQFKIKKVWILVDLPYGKKAINKMGL
ncbi:hypothetical protein Tco_1329463 [Tanacetum coccineum]